MSKELEVAQRAVLAGARRVKRFFGKSIEEIGLEYKHQDGDTPRTIIDRESGASILNFIKESFPSHAIYEEETGEHAGDADYLWVVDPFDGTSNAPKLLPYSRVGLALMKKGEIAVAAVCDPFEKKLYLAENGSGGFVLSLDDALTPVGEAKRLRVSTVSDPKARFIHVDSLFNDRNRKRKLGFMGDVTQLAHNVRSTGSNIHYGALLAEGRTDIWLIDAVGGFYDIAPGRLLINEAGGEVTDMHGNIPRRGVQVAIGSNNVGDHEQLTDLVRKHYQGYAGFR